MRMAGRKEELKMSLRQSKQQNVSPESKRSKPMDMIATADMGLSSEELLDSENRRLQEESMSVRAGGKCVVADNSGVTYVTNVRDNEILGFESESKDKGAVFDCYEGKRGSRGTILSMVEANRLFLMIYGNRVSREVLAQWSNQGVRFSEEVETSMGLVQHEGGPCGVLAAIQAFVLKYLLFNSEQSHNAPIMDNDSTMRTSDKESLLSDIFHHLSDDKTSRALVMGMTEILFLCGRNEKAEIASMDILGGDLESNDRSKDEVIAKILQGLCIESGSDLQKVLRVNTCTSPLSAFQKLETMLPIFRSRMGVMLFLISALLSRGLDNVQEDRDDPSQPLVTAPFGHASQEIVNLLLSGSAVANVFDGNMDLGGGMFVKGISTSVEVGFLTLLESLNFCKVGQNLKCPRWPIWVVGSESHYTVLFALDNKVQEDNEFENREAQIHRAFDAQDQSGGGGFVDVEGFHRIIQETNINLPPEKFKYLCSTGYIVWNDFWQILEDVDKNLGGVKGLATPVDKIFELFHFNGIAKSVGNGKASFRNENPIQRPRLTRLTVSVPPRCPPEKYWVDEAVASSSTSAASSGLEITLGIPAQYAPLVDCIRTRWEGAVCHWTGDDPSIV